MNRSATSPAGRSKRRHEPWTHRPRYTLSSHHAAIVFEAASTPGVVVADLASDDLDACLIDQSLYAPRELDYSEDEASCVFVDLDASERYAVRAAALRDVYDAPGSLSSALSALSSAMTAVRSSSRRTPPPVTAACGVPHAPFDDLLAVLDASSSPVLDEWVAARGS